jgi:hypothetical protein
MFGVKLQTNLKAGREKDKGATAALVMWEQGAAGG